MMAGPSSHMGRLLYSSSHMPVFFLRHAACFWIIFNDGGRVLAMENAVADRPGFSVHFFSVTGSWSMEYLGPETSTTCSSGRADGGVLAGSPHAPQHRQKYKSVRRQETGYFFA
jgi:hypothetical protein